MSSPLLVLRICPVSIDPQSGLPLRSRRHLVGGLVWFLLGICSDEPMVTIPVCADIGGDGISHGVETIGDKVPVTAVRLDEVLQELIVLWCPKLLGNTRVLYTLWIRSWRSDDEVGVTFPPE